MRDTSVRYSRLHKSLISYLSLVSFIFFFSPLSLSSPSLLPSQISSTWTIPLLPLRSHIPLLLRRASSLVSSRFPSSLSLLFLSLTISDLIRFVVQCCSRCDYMPEVPCSLGAMPELRRRVSLQSTTLLERRLSRMIGASSRIMMLPCINDRGVVSRVRNDGNIN